MARRLYTVNELALAVRSRIDEMNRDTIDDERDILPALNRALEYAVDIYARQYPDPYVTSTEIALVAGVSDYDLPEDAYEDRVVKLDLKYGGLYYNDLLRVSYKDISPYETTTSQSEPYYYAITGRTITVVPRPTDNSSLRVWYVKNPEQLVMPQGRITVVPTTGNYLVVDSVGSAITTESDELSNYVNVINARTGEIRATLQVSSIDDTRINLRAVPSSPGTVLGRDVTNLNNDALSTLGIKKDDYVCLATGTCVPYLSSPTSNFLIQFSVAELSRQLGINSTEEEQVLEKFEKQVKTTWAGREPTARVKKRSVAFGTAGRPWPLRQKGGDNG